MVTFLFTSSLRELYIADVVATVLISFLVCGTLLPLSMYCAKILLQTAPKLIVPVLDKSLREVGSNAPSHPHVHPYTPTPTQPSCFTVTEYFVCIAYAHTYVCMKVAFRPPISDVCPCVRETETPNVYIVRTFSSPSHIGVYLRWCVGVQK